MAYGTLNAGTITPGSGNTLTINETVTHTGAVTLPSPVINTGVSGTAILDEDAMGSNSATQLATQQSIKAYVDGVGSQTGADAQALGTGDSPSFAGMDHSSGVLRATSGLLFNADTAAANTLDDYEEGTWTPVPNSGTFGTVKVGTYTKIGDLVHVMGTMSWTVVGSATALSISGLPYLSNATTNYRNVGTMVGHVLQMDAVTTTIWSGMGTWLNPNASAFSLIAYGDGKARTTLQGDWVQIGTELTITITYKV
jgi:hypothetical protein